MSARRSRGLALLAAEVVGFVFCASALILAPSCLLVAVVRLVQSEPLAALGWYLGAVGCVAVWAVGLVATAAIEKAAKRGDRS